MRIRTDTGGSIAPVATSLTDQTPPALEAEIVALRRELKLGPARIAWRLEMAPSTVHRVLVRAGCNRLAWMDRPSGRVVRRIHTSRPGELVNIDIKKLSRVPDGGGWRVIGRAAARPDRDRRSRGIGYVHSAIDHYSSIAHSEALDDEQGETAAGFWRRANGFFSALGIHVEAALSWPGSTDVVVSPTTVPVTAVGPSPPRSPGVEHRFIKPYTPRTNGKAERFNRTLLDEWAYVRPYRSEAERIAALDDWLHLYNHHRGHSTSAGKPPITALNNLPRRYTSGPPGDVCGILIAMPQDPPRRADAPEPRRRPTEPRPREPRDTRARDEVDDDERRLDELQARWRRYGLAEGMRARAEPKPARKPPPAARKRAEERAPRPREREAQSGPAPRRAEPAATTPSPDTADLRELIRRLAEIERTAAGRVDALEEASDSVVRAVEEKAHTVQSRLVETGNEQAERLSGLTTQVGDLQRQVASLQAALVDSAAASGRPAEATEAARAALESLTAEQQQLAAEVEGKRDELETTAAGANALLATAAADLKADLESLTQTTRTDLETLTWTARSDVEALRESIRNDLGALGTELRTAQSRAIEEIGIAQTRLERVATQQSARLERLLLRVAAAERAPL